MLQHEWSSAAVACELVEIALQGPLARLADNRLALHCGINWAPEYTSWLFDTEHISADARRMLRELAPTFGLIRLANAEALALRVPSTAQRFKLGRRCERLGRVASR